ncbi:aminoglycoside phosphotransferase family protein [Bacillus salitolerans]|uniref:Aminoglycoside phosphotransferase family protein n=1 Tax=Bacillus salitolerans TaxID=1437434 RepID=A0ABW4LU56_9BACI
MELQEHFVQSVRLYFKEQGEEWLVKLPHIIDYCENNWSLRIKAPYSLSINYVAPAIMLDGREVVVKLSIPGKEFLNELKVLQLLNSKGIVQLIDYNMEKGILILEKITPGYTLAEMTDDEAACVIAADVVKNISMPAPDHTEIPTTKEREESLRRQFEKHNDSGPISKQSFEKALNIFAYLNHTIEQQMLLHGDFHHYNVLASSDGKWIAIDPKGLIGEIEYDLIQYLLNKLPNEDAYRVIERRVNIFTRELHLNKKRLLLWGYCHAVLATSWTIDENQNYDESFYQGIEIFERLYVTNFGEISSLFK